MNECFKIKQNCSSHHVTKIPSRNMSNQNRCLKMLLCFVKSGPYDSYIDLEGILEDQRSTGNIIHSLEDMSWTLIPAFCLITATLAGSGC